MTSQQGQFAWQAKRATGIANSVEANERRREPAIINWDKAIANLLDILNEEADPCCRPRAASGAQLTMRAALSRVGALRDTDGATPSPYGRSRRNGSRLNVSF